MQLLDVAVNPASRLPSLVNTLLGDASTAIHPVVADYLKRYWGLVCMCARSARATGRVLTSVDDGRGTRRLAQLPAEDSSASAIQLVRNVAGPLLHQLARMAGRLDPPAYLYLDGRGGQLTQPVDRFPLARLGFTIACWCVQCGRAHVERAASPAAASSPHHLKTIGRGWRGRFCVASFWLEETRLAVVLDANDRPIFELGFRAMGVSAMRKYGEGGEGPRGKGGRRQLDHCVVDMLTSAVA